MRLWDERDSAGYDKKANIGEPDSALYERITAGPSVWFFGKDHRVYGWLRSKVAYVDILSNPEIRATLPSYAEWPTFPQLWVDGELVGGCDIVTEMFESGELEALLSETTERHTDSEDS